MLVRLGTPSADLVRVVRTGRAPRALPGPASAARAEPQRPAEPVYAVEEPTTRVDLLKAQQACAAYLAADLVQPRPGLYLHVEA